MSDAIVRFEGSRVRIRRTGALYGSVMPPGSKSLSNRYLFCAALARESSILDNIAICDDTDRMLAGIRALGVECTLDRGAARAVVHGAEGGFVTEDVTIDAGAAGTAMRFLTALSALGHGHVRLDGTARMRERPIGPLVEALRSLGASIDYVVRDGFPPIVVHARGLSGGEVILDSPESSQYLSAVLMAAPRAAADVFLEITGRGLVSRPYVDMTLQVMRTMGVECLENDAARFVVEAPQVYRGDRFLIEPDASAATYFWAAAAMTGGCVRVLGLTRASEQGDSMFPVVLARMGCTVRYGGSFIEVAGPPRGGLRAITVDLNAMPDTVQTLAVVALVADGPTRIENVANLRLKETDRLEALARELQKLGARVETRTDGLTIHPPRQIVPCEIDTYDDHRMAMSFSLAGLACDGVVIRDAGCVSKSFPGFFDALNRLEAHG